MTQTYSAVSGGNAPTAKKMSTSMVILAACMLGVVVGLLGLNYWHTTGCANSKSPDEMEIYLEGIAKRLLQAESMVSGYGITSQLFGELCFTVLFNRLHISDLTLPDFLLIYSIFSHYFCRRSRTV